MERIPVISSIISSVGYYPDKQILEVEFKTGQVYQYFDVPAEKFENLLKAPSKGTYMRDHLIGKYEYIKINKLPLL